mgnify:CR=1 FL=1
MPAKGVRAHVQHQRRFTAAEATALVPFLQQAMTRLKELYAQARQAHREAQLCKAVGEGPDGRLIMEVDHEQASQRFEAAVAGMQEIIESVHARGCQIKDIQMGLVDFPARIGGRDVLLCWKLGEESVRYYHGLEDGYAGRRPIPPAYLPPPSTRPRPAGGSPQAS